MKSSGVGSPSSLAMRYSPRRCLSKPEQPQKNVNSDTEDQMPALHLLTSKSHININALLLHCLFLIDYVYVYGFTWLIFVFYFKKCLKRYSESSCTQKLFWHQAHRTKKTWVYPLGPIEEWNAFFFLICKVIFIFTGFYWYMVTFFKQSQLLTTTVDEKINMKLTARCECCTVLCKIKTKQGPLKCSTGLLVVKNNCHSQVRTRFHPDKNNNGQ